MSAKVRGGGNLWTAAALGNNAVSPSVTVGGDEQVALYVSNQGGADTVITVQVAHPRSLAPGINQPPTTFYNYLGADAIAVAAGANVCYDLTPFGPAYLRIKSSVATTVDAFVGSIG